MFFFKLFSRFLLFFFSDVTYELGNFSTKIKSLIVHLASLPPHLKKKEKKKIKSQSPTYVTIFVRFCSLPSCRPARTQARLVNRGSGREEKVLNVKIGFPKNPSLATPLPKGMGVTGERGGARV